DCELRGVLRGTVYWSPLLVHHLGGLNSSHGVVYPLSRHGCPEATGRAVDTVVPRSSFPRVLGLPPWWYGPAAAHCDAPILPPATRRQCAAVLFRRLVLQSWASRPATADLGRALERPPSPADRIRTRATGLLMERRVAPLPDPRRCLAAALDHRTLGTARRSESGAHHEGPGGDRGAAQRRGDHPRFLRVAKAPRRQLSVRSCSFALDSTLD